MRCAPQPVDIRAAVEELCELGVPALSRALAKQRGEVVINLPRVSGKPAAKVHSRAGPALDRSSHAHDTEGVKNAGSAPWDTRVWPHICGWGQGVGYRV